MVRGSAEEEEEEREGQGRGGRKRVKNEKTGKGRTVKTVVLS